MDPIQIVATLIILAGVVTKVTEAIRRRATYLHGFAVMLLAAGLGILLAWGLDLQGTEALLESMGGSAGRTPPLWLDYILTGVAIGAGSNFLADLTGRTGANAPNQGTERVLVTAEEE